TPNEKDAARHLVTNALYQVDYWGSKKVVRPNPLEYGGEKDYQMIVPAAPDALLLPKINTADELRLAIDLIKKYERSDQPPVMIIPLIETAMGVVHINEIAHASERIIALAFGAEDYSASIGAQRTIEGQEIFFARGATINAAASANVTALDTPFTDAQDDEGLFKDTMFAKSLGFKGKMAINPRQIDTIHRAFAPTSQEIRWATRVLQVIEEAKRQGSGVIALDGKMVDAPIVLRAERIMQMAKYLHLAIGENHDQKCC
ncbi:MAG: HpcH/HpaI aldolase/citrate lyase family protein, partial [Saezia sp.]